MSARLDEIEAVRAALLAAALRHVPFDGWSEAALAAAAGEAGVAVSAVRRAFPRGGLDLALYHSRAADARLEAELAAADLSSLRVRERVAHAVRRRLEPHAEDREAIRRALGLLALPGNGLHAVAALYRTVDSLWRAVGDRSTDFNFYTKRLLLAGVYLSTLLCFLDDRTPRQEASWAFLSRRIDDVMRIQTLRGRLDACGGGLALLRALRQGLGRLRPRAPGADPGSAGARGGANPG